MASIEASFRLPLFLLETSLRILGQFLAIGLSVVSSRDVFGRGGDKAFILPI